MPCKRQGEPGLDYFAQTKGPQHPWALRSGQLTSETTEFQCRLLVQRLPSLRVGRWAGSRPGQAC